MEQPSPFPTMIMEKLPLQTMSVESGRAYGIMMWTRGCAHFFIIDLNCECNYLSNFKMQICFLLVFLFVLFIDQWFVCSLGLIWHMFITFYKVLTIHALLLWVVNVFELFGIWNLEFSLRLMVVHTMVFIMFCKLSMHSH